MGSNSFTKKLERMPQLDSLAVATLALNAYVIYDQASFRSFEALLEPAASNQILIIQLSAVMAVVYLTEFVGDEENSSTGVMDTSSGSSDGIFGWIADLAEGNIVVTAASLIVVLLGFRSIQSSAGYGTSLFEFSADPTNIALQLSFLMIFNFGIQLLSELK